MINKQKLAQWEIAIVECNKRIAEAKRNGKKNEILFYEEKKRWALHKIRLNKNIKLI